MPGLDLDIQLKEAINTGNVDRIQQIVETPQGAAQINKIWGHETAIHSVFFAKHPPHLTRQMLQTFLDLRTADGRVLANLNKMHINAGAALTVAVDSNNLGHVQQILDTRHNDGSLAVNLLAAGNHGAFWSPLTRALFMNRLEIVQFFVDARRENGQPLLSPTDLENALYGAHVNVGRVTTRFFQNNDATAWLVNHLRQLGVHVGDENNVRLEPAILENAANNARLQPILAQPNINDFVQNSQNTHVTEVTISVEASCKRLLARYGRASLDASILDKIKKYIKQHKLTNTARKHALSCIDRIESTTMRRAGVELTLAEVLTLVWTAIEDAHALVDGLDKPLTAKDIDHRKETLINKLIESQTTYSHGPACFVGTFNKIVETLDLVHPDVVIITGKDCIVPVATERALKIVSIALKNETLRNQKEILKTWEDVDPKNGKTPATVFREQMAIYVNSQLQEEFQTLLTKQKREEITSAFNDLPTPVLHEKLDKLIDKINKIPADSSFRQTAIENLKIRAKQVFEPNDRSYQVEYEILQTKYNDLLKIDLISQKFRTSLTHYASTNEQRNASIHSIQTAISDAYFHYAQSSDDVSSILITLQMRIEIVRAAVYKDHKSHGALQLLGIFQPGSRLVKEIDEINIQRIMLGSLACA